MDRILKRRANLLYNLRKKGVRCLTKEHMIFFPYNENPHKVSQIVCLCQEYHFHVQVEIGE